MRKATKQLGHITLSLRVFLRPELRRLRGISWYESKPSVTQVAMRAYLTNPAITLASSA